MMKKTVIVFVTLLIVFGIPFNGYAYAFEHIVKPSVSTTYVPPEKSREELYQDVFMTLLLPYIQDEVDKYYKEYLTTSPGVAPYGVYILEADRVNGYRGFDFRLKIELHPYVGPHLSVGTDYITLRVIPFYNVKVEKFEHITSSELPPNYQDIIKKKLP
ncbi:DUF3888 domain-containing protein [Clostridium bowmanii]|uniref:DUF3888 domain-containing protein n=1 Tax=Clostridium bowmanii TaxID=132925 RepID=UPI001C0C7DE0|nr:DUF3888 domain-containing protein [Clostridium bowmanii]MBU3189385.1 DUF3888 domain-containing protein [Clostridium bowmanii]MCA1073999.1 DUF3888 domain-containing protein [Clostridium bowmanii]